MERMDKLLASAGLGSRKDVKLLFRQGRVKKNGQVVCRPEEKADPLTDAITVDDSPLFYEKYCYLMLNKPKGVISASRDKHTKTVVDLVPPELLRPGLFPAGRLDKDTEGFVLLTDDGQFAHDILSPRRHIPKTYVATLDKEVGQEAVAAFAAGMELGGKRTLSAELSLRKNGEATEYVVVLRQGMYHQIKRMFAHFGAKVLSLTRIRMGALFLDEHLAPGQCRKLTPAEREAILCRDLSLCNVAEFPTNEK